MHSGSIGCRWSFHIHVQARVQIYPGILGIDLGGIFPIAYLDDHWWVENNLFMTVAYLIMDISIWVCNDSGCPLLAICLWQVRFYREYRDGVCRVMGSYWYFWIY